MILLRLPMAVFRLFTQSVSLALGQIWANKVRAILTTIGIVIGVASVTTVVAALTGLKRNVLKDLESFGTNTIYVLPQRPHTGPKKHAPWRVVRFVPEHFDELLDHCPSVEKFARMAGAADTEIRHGEHAHNARILGIEPVWHEIEDRAIQVGRPFSLIDDTEARLVCLITADLRDKLRLDLNCVGERISVGNRSFVIVGVVAPPAERNMINEGQQPDEVFIPFRTSWKLYEGWVFGMATSRNPTVSDEARAELQFFLRRRKGLAPGEPNTFKIEPIQQYIQKFNQISAMVTVVAGGIVGISLVVGGVGIMNIMLVSVSERTREIGLRKAVGARDSAILMQFLVEAVVLCLIGGLVGVLVGQLLTSAMAHIPKAQLDNATIPLWAVLVAFGFSAGVGVTFGMFPALKAAQLDPIEALRHE